MDAAIAPQAITQSAPVKQDSISNTRDLLGPQKELDPDTIKHILDTDPIKRSIYFAYCGYYEYEETKTDNFAGRERTKTIKKIDKDPNNKVFNDAGGNWLYNGIMGLVAPGSTSSNATQAQIRNLWRGRSRSMVFTLRKSLYIPYAIEKTYYDSEKKLIFEKVIINNVEIEKPKVRIIYNVDERKGLAYGERYLFNPWELNPDRISDIITFICEAYLFTLKAGDGFTMEAFTKFVVAATQTIRREDMPIIVEQKKPGPIDRLLSLGKKT
jgi:hypothetical protein